MDFPTLELLDQRFVETAGIREKRELRLRQNAPRIVDDIEKVIRGVVGPSVTPNAVNEDRSKALSVKGRFPSKK